MANYEGVKKSVERNYTSEEIERFMKIGVEVAQKTVLHTVARMVDDAIVGGSDRETGEKLRDDILALVTSAGSRPFPVELDGGDQILVFLAPCKQDWKTRVAVPNEEVQAMVFTGYEYIRGTAHSYWNHFTGTQGEICKRLLDYLPGVEWSIKPALPTTSTTMWFDSASPHHMGIVCAYIHKGQLHPF